MSQQLGHPKSKTTKRWRRSQLGLVPEGRFTQISVATDNACALGEDGNLTCWGRLVNEKHTPSLGTFVQVSIGRQHDCAVSKDSTIHCWGSNKAKQLEVPDGKFRFVSVGKDFTCAIRIDDSAACWASNGFHTPSRIG